MAIHSGILAWEIPWTEEPGGLLSVGLQRIWHDRVIKKQNSAGHPVSLASLSAWKFLSLRDDRVEESGLCFSFLPFPWWLLSPYPRSFLWFLTSLSTIFLMSLWEVCGEESARTFEFFLYLCFQQVQYLYNKPHLAFSNSLENLAGFLIWLVSYLVFSPGKQVFQLHLSLKEGLYWFSCGLNSVMC